MSKTSKNHEDDSLEPDPIMALKGMPKKVTALINKESERGLILILSSYLEEILGYMIRRACTSDSIGKSLIESRGPAGDFSGKISLCLAFGLISAGEHGALTCLRKIRNNAAHFDHNGREFDVLFDSQKTIDVLNQMRMHLDLDIVHGETDKMRHAFIRTSRLLASLLLLRYKDIKPASKLKSNLEIAADITAKRKGTPLVDYLATLQETVLHENCDIQEMFEHLSGVLHYFKNRMG